MRLQQIYTTVRRWPYVCSKVHLFCRIVLHLSTAGFKADLKKSLWHLDTAASGVSSLVAGLDSGIVNCTLTMFSQLCSRQCWACCEAVAELCIKSSFGAMCCQKVKLHTKRCDHDDMPNEMKVIMMPCQMKISTQRGGLLLATACLQSGCTANLVSLSA